MTQRLDQPLEAILNSLLETKVSRSVSIWVKTWRSSGNASASYLLSFPSPLVSVCLKAASSSLEVAFVAGPAAASSVGVASEGAIWEGDVCDGGPADLDGELAELCVCAVVLAHNTKAAIKSTLFASKRGIKFSFTDRCKLMQDSVHNVEGNSLQLNTQRVASSLARCLLVSHDVTHRYICRRCAKPEHVT